MDRNPIRKVLDLQNNSSSKAAPKTAVILVNLGTPDRPTYWGVFKFLREFLSDEAVIRIPKWIWRPLLYTFVLPLRPFFVAQKYKKIWTKEGSLLRVLSERLAVVLQDQLSTDTNHITVILGMTYGRPSLKKALLKAEELQAESILILPLYPLTSITTIQPIQKIVHQFIQNHPSNGICRILPKYGFFREYLTLLQQSIEEYWSLNGRKEHLIFSFHGIPERYLHLGETYCEEVYKLSQIMAQRLKLPEKAWSVGFQSRFGFTPWVKPYLNDILKNLAQSGIRSLDILSPGFAVDCLETEEELKIKSTEIFKENGGIVLSYIPALNDSIQHGKVLKNYIESFF